MKKSQLTPFTWGIVSLIVLIAVLYNIKPIIAMNNVAWSVIAILLPLAALLSCVYFFIKGGRNVEK